jgi:rhodanese-related sulfurtransferase
MDKPVIAATCFIILILVASGCALNSSGFADIERVSAKQLQGMLGRSDVIVVDVRSNSDWNKSESKIKGAVREDLSGISSWIDKYPKGKTLVFYCA